MATKGKKRKTALKTSAKARTGRAKAAGKTSKKAGKKPLTTARNKKPVKRAPKPLVATGEPEVTVYEVVETEVYAEPAVEVESEEEEFGT